MCAAFSVHKGRSRPQQRRKRDPRAGVGEGNEGERLKAAVAAMRASAAVTDGLEEAEATGVVYGRTLSVSTCTYSGGVVCSGSVPRGCTAGLSSSVGRSAPRLRVLFSSSDLGWPPRAHASATGGDERPCHSHCRCRRRLRSSLPAQNEVSNWTLPVVRLGDRARLGVVNASLAYFGVLL